MEKGTSKKCQWWLFFSNYWRSFKMTNCITQLSRPTLFIDEVSYPQVCHSISPWMERQVVFFQTLKYLISKKKWFCLGGILKRCGSWKSQYYSNLCFVLCGIFFGRAFKWFLTLHCHVGFNVRFWVHECIIEASNWWT